MTHFLRCFCSKSVWHRSYYSFSTEETAFLDLRSAVPPVEKCHFSQNCPFAPFLVPSLRSRHLIKKCVFGCQFWHLFYECRIIHSTDTQAFGMNLILIGGEFNMDSIRIDNKKCFYRHIQFCLFKPWCLSFLANCGEGKLDSYGTNWNNSCLVLQPREAARAVSGVCTCCLGRLQV